MNKYKTQETACYTFISMWVIGIILIMLTSSCATSTKIHKKPVGKRYTNTCHSYL